MVVATLALIIGVLCVLVGVAMVVYQKRAGRRPGASFWASVVVLAPVAYVASFVFTMVLDSKGVVPDGVHEILEIFYAPIAWIVGWTLWKLGINLD
jgi:hypothetical protein